MNFNANLKKKFHLKEAQKQKKKIPAMLHHVIVPNFYLSFKDNLLFLTAYVYSSQ